MFKIKFYIFIFKTRESSKMFFFKDLLAIKQKKLTIT